ncbi:Pre-mRNA-splicing factor SPF27 [Triangularia verruculosa]|uniref:Pre-mRNA-splicing factor SPF27 n=1 Tax=Triangularia verruculosa TaxID=2587418 RepID=A0AAN6X4Z4_9PEZI|nr:Pre-mRNA-splicing factor SPF27 [Triangularia verruculosa]
MPSITTIHESLPYVDEPPTESLLAAAHSLIAQERQTVPDDEHHALLPLPYTPKFLTPLLQSEFDRLSSSTNQRPAKLNALDLSRYNSLPSQPDQPTPNSLQSELSKAYISHSYVSSRRAHLALLDTYGKNAWLTGNYFLEGELKQLEKELAETKQEIDLVTLARKTRQEEAEPEMKMLEENWKAGVGRVLETELATEGLRREILGVLASRE